MTTMQDYNEQRRREQEQRRKHIQEIKRKRRIRKLIVAAGFLLVIAIVASPILVFSVFRVKTINLKGKLPYSNEEIIDACPVKSGDSILLANYDKAVEVLEKKLPYLSDVKITRSLPWTITITAGVATEKVAIELQSENTYLLLDKNLRILKTFGYVPDTATVFRTPAPVSTKEGETIAFESVKDEDGNEVKSKINTYIKEILAELDDEKLTSKITYVDLRNTGDIRIVYDGRIMMKLGNASSLASKIELGSSVIEQENLISSKQQGTLDLTIVKKAYFNPDVFDEGTGDEEETETVIDEDGNVVEPETVTDEYGNVVEPETVTDENGNIAGTAEESSEESTAAADESAEEEVNG